MKSMLNRAKLRTAAVLLGVVTVAGVPLLTAQPVAAEEEAAKQFKVIVTFVGEQPTGAQAAVGITIRGVLQTDTVAIDLDGNPDTLDIISQPIYFDPASAGEIIAFGETNGTANLADYTTSASCKAHTEEVDPGWSNASHTGSIQTYPYENYVCTIVNTRKPANLTLAQTATETSAFPGDTIHYTLSTTNNGSSTATDVKLEGSLATTVNACKIGMTDAANPAPTLAAGATLTCKANYVVPSNVVGDVVTNVAKVSSPSDTTPPADVSTSVAITRVASEPPVVPPVVPPVTEIQLFNPVAPARLFDSRPTDPQGLISVVKQKYSGTNVLQVTVTNVGGIPATGAAAVSLNVTAVGAGDTGFVTVYPCGTRPGVSSLNYTAGRTVAGAVIAPISAGGTICLYSSADVYLVADVNGWIAANVGFTSVSPNRLVDTRPGEAQGSVTVTKKVYGGTSELKIKVTNVAGVPATGVAAVSLNVTAVGPNNTGYVTVYPCGALPGVSSLNYTSGTTVANAVIAPVSTLGEICLFSTADTHLLVDINGWLATDADFATVGPTRLFDSRIGEAQGAITITKKVYGDTAELKIKVTNVAGVPATGVAAVSLNITAVGATNTGFITVYPCGTRPGVSSLNYTAGQIVANAVIVPVSSLGEICIYSSVDTNLIGDINGWFASVATA